MNTSAGDAVQSGSASSSPRLVIWLLFLGYLLSYGDRYVFSLVLSPMELFLHLTDTQLGLLAGLGFALAYSLCSPLAGLLVDRLRRKSILMFAIAFWSCATFSCGLASTPLMMACARAAVGVGEALMVPIAVSVIGDTVALPARARTMAFIFTGGPFGSLAVLVAGGGLLRYFLHHPVTLPFTGIARPWQSLFMFLALPGLLLCLAVLLTMKEPPREAKVARPRLESHQVATLLRFIRGNGGLCLGLFLGFPLLGMSGVAMGGWAFVYFDRIYGMPLDQAAVAFSLSAGITTIIGCLLSGRLIDLLRRRGYADASLRACLLGGVLFAVFAVFGLLARGAHLALGFFALAFFFSYVPTVGAFSAISEMAPPGIRASFTGLNTLSAALITGSLGPYLVGAFSDHLFAGRMGIRWAMMTTLALSVVCGAALTIPGLKPLRERIEALRADTQMV